MEIDLLLVPYDSGHRGERMGAGPQSLVDSGLAERLERQGHRVRLAEIEPRGDGWRAEIRTAFDLAAALAVEVRATRTAGRVPLVLAGNCVAALGVRGGLGEDVGVIWADAHGDFNTPEITTGGFLDGMALAALAGRCWTGMASRIPGFVPVPERLIWLLGARDLDPAEADALGSSGVRRLPPEAVDAAAAGSIARSLGHVENTYLHLDLDVLDPSEGRVNQYSAPDGVRTEALENFCRALRHLRPPAAVTLSAYDPAADADGRACEAALRVVEALFEHGDDGPDARVRSLRSEPHA